MVYLFILFVITLAAYAYCSLKGGYVAQLITKTIASLFFVFTAVWANYTADGNRLYFSLMLMGLVCSLAGDIFIQGQKAGDNRGHAMLATGIGAFFVAHCFYIAAFVHLSPFSLWDIPVFILPFIALRGMFALLHLNFGKLKIASYVYLSAILLMFTKALSLTYLGGGFTLPSALLMAGAVLFAVSDTLLTLFNFYPPCKGSKAISAAVTITYYTAQALFAVSIAFVGG